MTNIDNLVVLTGHVVPDRKQSMLDDQKFSTLNGCNRSCLIVESSPCLMAFGFKLYDADQSRVALSYDMLLGSNNHSRDKKSWEVEEMLVEAALLHGFLEGGICHTFIGESILFPTSWLVFRFCLI